MSGFAYVGTVGDTTDHLFHFLADGDRPVLEIYVDAVPGQAELPIRIKGVGQPLDNMQVTKGFTVINSMPNVDSEGDVTGMTAVPDPALILNYIVPRIHTLMARVYVPKQVDSES